MKRTLHRYSDRTRINHWAVALLFLTGGIFRLFGGLVVRGPQMVANKYDEATISEALPASSSRISTRAMSRQSIARYARKAVSPIAEIVAAGRRGGT